MKCVLIREVSSFQGANNTYLCEVGTWSSVLIREVSLIQGCLLRGVPLYYPVPTHSVLSPSSLSLHRLCSAPSWTITSLLLTLWSSSLSTWLSSVSSLPPSADSLAILVSQKGGVDRRCSIANDVVHTHLMTHVQGFLACVHETQQCYVSSCWS